MINHKLKSWPEYFEAVYTGMKTFEVRNNDRNFMVGDVVTLWEWNPKTETYSGRWAKGMITYKTDFGCAPGMVVFALSVTLRGRDVDREGGEG